MAAKTVLAAASGVTLQVPDLNLLLRRPVQYYQRPWAIERVFAEARSHWRSLSRPGDITYVYSKSMPRSGHRLLAECLTAYFHDTLHYCEYYPPGDCCRRIPCAKPYNETRRNCYFMQKSHDFGFRDATHLPGKYLIQFRSPIPRLQSNFELYARDTGRGDAESFYAFATRETTYFINFYRKWIAKPRPSTLVFSYEELTQNQGQTLKMIISFITGNADLDLAALQAAIASAPAGVARLSAPQGGFRDPRTHAYSDPQFFAELEARVAEACGTDRIRFHFLGRD